MRRIVVVMRDKHNIIRSVVESPPLRAGDSITAKRLIRFMRAAVWLGMESDDIDDLIQNLRFTLTIGMTEE